MGANDSCRLITNNLYSFVEYPFTDKAYFNFNKFQNIVYRTMVLSDDLVDLELEYVDRIIEKIKSDPEPDYIKQIELDTWLKLKENGRNGRRTGVGFTGLGDVLAALNLKYGSDESLEFIRTLMNLKLKTELNATIDLAILRGSFEGWNRNFEFLKSNPDMSGDLTKSFFGRNDFFQMLVEEFPEEAKRMYEYGRRNVSWSTFSPTGSVSILTQTTSGIEPLFKPFYKRRRKVNENEEYDFIDDTGDKWKEYFVIHPKFKDWWIINKTQVSKEKNIAVIYKNLEYMTEEELNEAFKQSPYYGSIAEQIDWIDRIKVQSILQKYTTHSISSTINLPENVSIEKIEELYMKAWEEGLKGLTIYREGSRTGVLVDTKDVKIQTNEDNHAIKRPSKLQAIVVPFRNYRESWIALIGLLENRPYEIFTFKKPDNWNNDFTKGIIQKVKKERRYDFIVNDYVLEDIGRLNDDIRFSDMQRAISALLRHRMPLEYTVKFIDTLTLDGNYITTWKAGVKRAIKQFLKDIKTGENCPICNEKVVMEEGCLICKNCGWSKCS